MDILIILIFGIVWFMLISWGKYILELVRKLDSVPDNDIWDKVHDESEYYSMEWGCIMDC